MSKTLYGHTLPELIDRYTSARRQGGQVHVPDPDDMSDPDAVLVKLGAFQAMTPGYPWTAPVSVPGHQDGASQFARLHVYQRFHSLAKKEELRPRD